MAKRRAKRRRWGGARDRKRDRRQDEYLLNGSVIYWSRRFRDGRYPSGPIRWRVPVRCGQCGEVREVSAGRAHSEDFTGLCRDCAAGFKTEDERQESGSVVYWSQRFKDRRGRDRVPVRCGGCGLVREIDTDGTYREGFTGLCHACACLSMRFHIPRSTLEHLYCKERLSQEEIAERTGCTHTTVGRAMKRYGIEARSPKVPPTLVPEEVLERWAPELAYVVGLVATDGNLEKGCNVVTFRSTDWELIENYQRCLRVSVHVVTCTYDEPGWSPLHCVGFSDPAYRAFLEGVGLTPAKTKERTLGPLKILDEFFRDFFRGVIDGDGYICVRTRKGRNKRELSVSLPSVCRPFLVWIRDTIARLAAMQGNVYRIPGAFRLDFTGRKACRLLAWVYYGPDLPCMQRKREVWEAYLAALPRATAMRTVASPTGLWHIADETNHALCGKDATRWSPVLVTLQDCLHDDGHVCRACREALAHLLELDRYRRGYNGSADVRQV